MIELLIAAPAITTDSTRNAYSVCALKPGMLIEILDLELNGKHYIIFNNYFLKAHSTIVQLNTFSKESHSSLGDEPLLAGQYDSMQQLMTVAKANMHIIDEKVKFCALSCASLITVATRPCASKMKRAESDKQIAKAFLIEVNAPFSCINLIVG